MHKEHAYMTFYHISRRIGDERSYYAYVMYEDTTFYHLVAKLFPELWIEW